jgi:two-component system LytT family sensor kinase
MACPESAALTHTATMPLRRTQAWLLGCAFWTLFAVVCASQVWMSMITHGHRPLRILLYQIVVWDAWALLGAGISRLSLRVPLTPWRTRNALVHLLAACVIAVVHAAWWVTCMLVIRPYDKMNPTDFAVPFLEIAFYQLPLEVLLYALVLLFAHASEYYARYQERELRSVQLERSLAEARLHALELQIQPHFLFNTLNAISTLVRTGRDQDAVAMIGGLSDLLRYALDRADHSVPVSDETEMLRRYLEIQRLRFADRLTFAIDVAGDASRAAVPVLLLQPLAENAIRHGIATCAGAGHVSVRAYRSEGTLHIEMLNTGRLAMRVAHGIGLSNTVARLQQLYGDRQRFLLTDTDAGVLAAISIPWTEVA